MGLNLSTLACTTHLRTHRLLKLVLNETFKYLTVAGFHVLAESEKN